MSKSIKSKINKELEVLYARQMRDALFDKCSDELVYVIRDSPTARTIFFNSMHMGKTRAEILDDVVVAQYEEVKVLKEQIVELKRRDSHNHHLSSD